MLNFTADQLVHLFKSNVSECEYERGEEKKNKKKRFSRRVEMLMRPRVCPMKRLMATLTLLLGDIFGNANAEIAIQKIC